MSEDQTDFRAANKKVDESWKNSIENEKDVPDSSNDQGDLPVLTFSFFISSLGVEAMIALGQIAAPGTSETKANLPQAKYLIEIIRMLSEKTKGNLSKEEEDSLKDLLYHLEMQFVEKSGAA